MKAPIQNQDGSTPADASGSVPGYPDSAPFPVIRVSADGLILYANPASRPVLAAWHCEVGERLSAAWRKYIGETITSGHPVCHEMVCDTRSIRLTFLVANGTGVEVYGEDITAQKRAETWAIASRASFHNVVENSPDGIIVVDSHQVVRFVNAAAVAIFGAKVDDLVGENFAFSVGPDSMLEIELLRRDGTVGTGEMRVSESVWESEPANLVLIRDITDRKRAEEALRKSAQEFHNLAEAMPQMVWITRADGWTIYFNQQWMDYTGLTLEESLGHGWNKPFHPDDQQRAWDAWQHATKEDGIYAVECRLRRADGTYRWWLIRGVPQKDAAGKTLKWFGTCTDIHDMKLAEETLTRLAAIVEFSNDAIIGRDLNGIITSLNRGAEKLFGYTSGELVGSSIMRLIPADHQDEENQILEKIRRGEPVAPFETLCQAKDGRLIDLSVTASPIKGADGKVVGVSKVARDITERKKSETERQQMQTTLEQSNRDLQNRNDEIQAFYHTLSHELKTPLTSAREFIAILMDGLAGSLNETQLEYLGIAKESCDQLRLYINDLLDVTRLETGKLSIEFQAAALPTLVEAVLKMLTPAAIGKGISLSSDCEPNLPDVSIDKHRIMQVLTNLIVNAIKFTPAGGQIQLRVCESPAEPDCLQVSVRDTGSGIPQDHLGLIFNRLHQVKPDHGSAESRSGIGLGLYICQELVQLHGGRLSVESELNRGSTFTFTIPKYYKPPTVNVLVVDDDARIRGMLYQRLEKEGYHVTLAGGGAEALRLMRQQQPALVILDLQMPGMDGAETLAQIRAGWGAIPVVIHTSYPEGDLMMRILTYTPFTVLAKPCPAEQMLNTVRSLTQRIMRRPGNVNRTNPKPLPS